MKPGQLKQMKRNWNKNPYRRVKDIDHSIEIAEVMKKANDSAKSKMRSDSKVLDGKPGKRKESGGQVSPGDSKAESNTKP